MPTPSPAAPALALLLAGMACWAQPAAAQVMRCTDPATGQVTYTDGGCHRGDAVREVQERQSPQDIARERQQAAEALERRQERLRLEAEQRRDAQQAERAARQATTAPRDDPAQSMACRQARRQLQQVLATMGQGMYDEQSRLDAAQRQADLACLSPAEQARTERRRDHHPGHATPYYAPPVVVVPPRPMPPPPRREIANCNVFRCYDAQGNTYPR